MAKALGISLSSPGPYEQPVLKQGILSNAHLTSLIHRKFFLGLEATSIMTEHTATQALGSLGGCLKHLPRQHTHVFLPPISGPLTRRRNIF